MLPTESIPYIIFAFLLASSAWALIERERIMDEMHDDDDPPIM